MPLTPRSDYAARLDSLSPAARIVAGARAHFYLHGFHRVTMDELASELRMSKKTLYAHFPSKASLLEAVIAQKIQQVEADLRRVSEEAGLSFAGRLQALLACIRGHAEELQPAFLRDVRTEAPELFTRLQARRRELIQLYFGRLFREGRQAGAVRRDVPVRLLVEILVGAVNAITLQLDELGLTAQSAFTQVTSVFLTGALVRNPEPRK